MIRFAKSAAADERRKVRKVFGNAVDRVAVHPCTGRDRTREQTGQGTEPTAEDGEHAVVAGLGLRRRSLRPKSLRWAYAMKL